MPIYQQGSLNTTSLVVPDLYVQIVPPQQLALNGVPSNVIGVVGSAQWGPKNTATIVGNMAQYAANFGALQNRLYDMGTVVAAAVLQGASSFKCVRVTDGTDVAATSAGVILWKAEGMQATGNEPGPCSLTFTSRSMAWQTRPTPPKGVRISLGSGKVSSGHRWAKSRR